MPNFKANFDTGHFSAQRENGSARNPIPSSFANAPMSARVIELRIPLIGRVKYSIIPFVSG